MTKIVPNPISSLIEEQIEREGGITFARFMDLALYADPDGYYRSSKRRPGRGGDFLTAPEMHPLFGLTVARQIAECWRSMDQPEQFTIREYGAGVGGFAYDILAGLLDAEPQLRSGLRYEMVEVNGFRAHQAMRAMIEVGLDDVVTVVDAPEDLPLEGVAIANEVADALPVHRLVVRNGSLLESWVVLDNQGGFIWEERQLSKAVADFPKYLDTHGVDLTTLPEGSVIETSPAASEWIREIALTLTRGYALIIDYGYPVAELLRDHRLQGTLRGYSQHTVNDNPFLNPGGQDLTAHVDFDRLIDSALAEGMHVEGLTTQADFLERNGLGELLVAMQTQEGITPDVYYRAQSAVYRLIDPGGMGRFRVLGLSKGVRARALRGFVETGLHM